MLLYAPCVYIPRVTQLGYTFVCDARTGSQPLASGRWRLRLIGAHSPIPSPTGPEVNSSFAVTELREYYLPNNHCIIFRSDPFIQKQN